MMELKAVTTSHMWAMTDILLTAKRSDSHDQYYMLVLLTGNRMDGGGGMMKMTLPP